MDPHKIAYGLAELSRFDLTIQTVLNYGGRWMLPLAASSWLAVSLWGIPK